MTLPPTKTALGLEELRLRKRKLGQRHRTMLLLVDGKRSREAVLGLAQQAGVAPCHFDELLAWGMVAGEPLVAVVEEVQSADPVTPEPPAAPAASEPEGAATEAPPVAAPGVAEAAPALEEPVAAVGAAVPVGAGTADDASVATAVEPVPDAVPVLPVEPTAIEAAVEPSSVAAPADRALLSIELAPVAAPRPLPVRRVTPSRRSARIAAPPLPRELPMVPLLPLESPRTVPVLSEPLLGELPVHIRPVTLDASYGVPPPAEGSGDSEEDRVLGEVRGLLIGTLLVDAPVSSSLTALRVHRARDRESLVRLVWEVERSLVRARRPREAQARLGRARELLGLGNTVVHEQTLPGYSGGD
ncbi:MAG TPA: hypothetical protein VLI72_13965 [Methylibium sp.]|nr:hypothetical protein [Methylibium sp.]